MPFAFCLRDYGFRVLPQDRDGGEAVLVRRRLCLLYPFLQLLRRKVAFSSFRYYEAERYEVVRVRQCTEVVPVLLVESCEWCEDQDCLSVLNWIGGCGHVVHQVVYYWRWRWFLIRAQLCGFPEG